MSIASELTRIQNAKAGIKSAIEAKGVTVGDGTIDTYPAKINEIQTGGGSVDEYFKSTIYAGEGESYPGYVNSILKLPPFTFNGTNANYMFSRYKGTQIMFDDNFDTSSTTSMQYMFNECINLISLDLSGFNTSNVSNMSWMFYHCSSLTSLDLSSFNTSRVKFMGAMFYYCNKLETINVSNFNTSKVTNMASMFNLCSSLTNLDLSNFDTSNVDNMNTMFQRCTSLQNLNISNFDFTKVTSYSGMFTNVPKDCYILVKDATAKEWITSKFTNLTNVHYVGEEG